MHVSEASKCEEGKSSTKGDGLDHFSEIGARKTLAAHCRWTLVPENPICPNVTEEHILKKFWRFAFGELTFEDYAIRMLKLQDYICINLRRFQNKLGKTEWMYK